MSAVESKLVQDCLSATWFISKLVGILLDDRSSCDELLAKSRRSESIKESWSALFSFLCFSSVWAMFSIPLSWIDMFDVANKPSWILSSKADLPSIKASLKPFSTSASDQTLMPLFMKLIAKKNTTIAGISAKPEKAKASLNLNFAPSFFCL